MDLSFTRPPTQQISQPCTSLPAWCSNISLSAGPPPVYVLMHREHVFFMCLVSVWLSVLSVASHAVLHDWLTFISWLSVIYVDLSPGVQVSICVCAITHMLGLWMCWSFRVTIVPPTCPCAPLETLRALILCVRACVCSPVTWVIEVVCSMFAVHETILYVVICKLRCLLDTNVCSLMLFTGTLLHQEYWSEPGSVCVCVCVTIDLYHSQ